MEILGIASTCIMGFSILITISKKFNLWELVGMSFLTGIGTQTFIMFLLNFSGTDFTAIIIISTNLIISLILQTTFFTVNRKILFYSNQFHIKSLKNRFKFGKANIIWWICIALIGFIIFSISKKSLYWPTFASDSLSSFDLFAKGLAHEGKILNSLIYEKRVGYGAAYPPLYSLALAYTYMLGFETSKLIPVLFFISGTISFYAILKKITNQTNAIFFTLLAISTPELLSQSAINITSVPQAIYASLAIGTLVVWYKLKEERYFVLSIFLMAFSAFTRSEGVVYTIAAFMFLMFTNIKSMKLLNPLLYTCLALIPFLLWQLFIKMNADIMNQFIQVEIINYPNLDMVKINKIKDLTIKVIFNSQYYGITPFIFIAVFFLNIKKSIVEKDQLGLLFMIIVSFLGYLILINQFQIKSDTIDNIINYSGKRFFFGIVLLMWFYIASNKTMVNGFIWLENWLNPKHHKN
jgi:hypothetical protein